MPLPAVADPKSMVARLGAAMAVLAGVLLLTASVGVVQALHSADERQALDAATVLGRSYANELRTRLIASEQVVQAVVDDDAGFGGAALRARILRSEIVRGVVLAVTGGAAGPVPLDHDERLALRSGRTLLRTGTRTDAGTPVYLVHAVRVGAIPVVAFFELAPDWLWHGSEPGATASAVLAVIDHDGTLLSATGALPPDLLALYAREALPADAHQPEVVPRSWNVRGREWRGAAVAMLPQAAHLEAGRWTVIASRPQTPVTALWWQAAGMLPLPLLCAALVIGLACAWLRRRWEPVLASVRAGLRELAAGRYQRIELGKSGEAPRATAVEFNRAIVALADRMRSLSSLSEIDRMLLESEELEACLEPLLERIGRITVCDCAMLVLLDPDVSDYGRAFVSASGTHSPVSRINLDPDLLAQLGQERAGLTVARYEPGRHSLLEPLHAQGADFYWVWPVMSQDRLAAVLAVGYRGMPQVDPEVAALGTECAARIGVALSNSARGEQLYRQAHYDVLTGLPNRLLFRDRLSQELASAVDGRQRGALLYVDLDHFKKINDTVGHSAGDQLLQVVAQRLRACIKEGDTVARLGGDEFTIILRGVGSAEAAQRVAERVSATLQESVNISGRDYFVRASIGITLFPDDASALEDLMRNADLAMYRAKEAGRARAVFYDRSMQRMPALAAESGLYKALQRREFTLYYQPQYSLADGKLAGLEALLRWQPPREAMRLPGEFVPAAEQSGLIVDIGAWVLEAGCAQLAQWTAEGVAPPRLALNVSVFQLRQTDFPKLVRRALTSAGIAPGQLEFEVTESVFADEEALATLHRLAALGVHLSLDDFGTGYSSLGYLRAHPVHSIKIDRSFIEDVADNTTAATLVETMINMAHALGKQVVAEGVETMSQLEFLRTHRCDYAQGFYLARPAAVTDITALLQGQRAEPAAQALASA